MRLSPLEAADFNHLCEPVIQVDAVQKMRAFVQHGNTSTYDHSLSVARCSYWLCRRLPFRFSEASVVRGALLHDLYLYDWHDDDPSHRLHGFYHPRTALCNAKKYFTPNPVEQNIISSHMWPLTLRSVPRTREAAVVCLADKCCTLSEFFRHRFPRKAYCTYSGQ